MINSCIINLLVIKSENSGVLIVIFIKLKVYKIIMETTSDYRVGKYCCQIFRIRIEFYYHPIQNLVWDDLRQFISKMKILQIKTFLLSFLNKNTIFLANLFNKFMRCSNFILSTFTSDFFKFHRLLMVEK
jgi:hypothetical protein